MATKNTPFLFLPATVAMRTLSVGCRWRYLSRAVLPARAVTTPFRSLHIDTLHICRDLIGCGTVEDVSSHFRRFQLHYDVINHLAALNRIAQLDPARQAIGLLLPHLLVLERFLAPSVLQLAPREIMTFFYVAALYARSVPSGTRNMLEAALVRQLRTVDGLGIASVWSGPRRGDEQGLTRVPQECFASICGRTGDLLPQDVPNALWAATKTQLSAQPIMDSIWGELLPILRAAGGAPALTFDSILRISWAAASRAGSESPGIREALADALAARSLTSKPTFAQEVLLAWAFVTMQMERHPHITSLIRTVLDPQALSKAREALAPSAIQQLVQLHNLLVSRQGSMAALGIDSSALPSWMFQRNEERVARVPIEANPQRDAAVVSISAVLRSLRLKHATRYIVDGYSIDVALPLERVGILLAASHSFRSVTGRSRWRGEPRAIPSALQANSERGNNSSVDLASTKRAYLSSQGWRLATIELGQWRHLGEEQKAQLLLDLISSVGGLSRVRA
jgi:hypothetical protein